MPETAYVALGSNLGDRAAHLALARAAIAALPSTRVTGESPIDETAPIGPVSQGAYLNQMLRVETTLAPETLLDALLDIETRAGRVRDVRWGPRTLDLDVVLYGNRALRTPRITVPHPQLAQRDFWQSELAALGVDWAAAVASAAPDGAAA